jgi:hypothetical protein
MCPVPLKPAVLQWYGYAAEGGGFHYLEMDEAVLAASVAEQENAATVIINNVDPRSKLSVQLLTDDLKKLVDANWDWQVKRTSDSDFAVVFPNLASLNLCKNTGGLTLPISKVSVLFVEPRLDSGASASLAKVWLLLSGVPEVLRRSDLLMEATKMLEREEWLMTPLWWVMALFACCFTPPTLVGSRMRSCSLPIFRATRLGLRLSWPRIKRLLLHNLPETQQRMTRKLMT